MQWIVRHGYTVTVDAIKKGYSLELGKKILHGGETFEATREELGDQKFKCELIKEKRKVVKERRDFTPDLTTEA